MRTRFLQSPFWICLTIFISYLTGLWGTSIPLTGDQKVYLSAALEMYENHQWVIPSIFSEPNFLKPPFQYWASILGWKVFGLSIFGALLPSVIALVGSSFLVFKLGEKLRIANPGISALLFAATLGSMTYGSTAQMEIWIVFFLLAAWLAALSSRMFIAFILVGMMAWVKGPLYPVLWTACFLFWDFKAIRSRRFWIALFVGASIGLTWYFLAARTHREEMIHQFLYTENLGKIGTKQGSVFGLWGEFFFSLFPWMLLLIAGAFQSGTREKWKENRRFFLSYALIPALFFTFFPYRVNSYLYFLTPMLALMVSEIDLQKKSFALRSVAIIYGLLFALLITMLFRLWRGGWIGEEILIAGILTILVFFVGLFKADPRAIAVSSLLLVNLIRVSAVQIGEKDMSGLREWIRGHPGEYAFFIQSRDIWHEYGLISSATGQSVQRIFNESDLEQFLKKGGQVIFQEDQVWTGAAPLICAEWPRLKRRTKFPIRRLWTEGLSWGDPEITRIYRICGN